MNYEEALAYIKSTDKYGIKPGLITIKELLVRLDNPQDNLEYIHVAGTNGKGSTIAFIESIFREGGYSTGIYISPSVFDYREKIQISGEFVTKKSIAENITLIKEIILDMIKDGFNHPTAYEIETAMAFLCFKKAKCDIVIIETGMGGSLDSTNIINNTICSVITSISLDHIKILGDTPEKIAHEKSGIIKANSNVILYKQEDIITKIISNKAKEENSKLIQTDFTKISNPIYGVSEIIFSYKDLSNIKIHLLGEHQVKNAVTAIETALLFMELGYNKINKNIIKQGLEKAIWQGRFEIINREPMFIIDGAHNEDAAKILKKSIKTYFADRKVIYILGVLKDKDYISMLNETVEPEDTIITVTPNNKRALDSEQLAVIASKYCKSVIDAKDIYNAMKIAVKLANSYSNDEKCLITAFGSLTYLGEVKRLTKEIF